MSVVVAVSLISGNTVSVEAGLDESVATLKRRAQTALAVAKGRLRDSSGVCRMPGLRPKLRLHFNYGGPFLGINADTTSNGLKMRTKNEGSCGSQLIRRMAAEGFLKTATLIQLKKGMGPH